MEKGEIPNDIISQQNEGSAGFAIYPANLNLF